MTPATTEARLLGLIRDRYEADGYAFIEHPQPSDLPSFMGGYLPDAIALGKDKSIAIEVKLRQRPQTEKNLRTISERFKGQPHWEFRIVYGEEVDDETILAPTREEIGAQISEAESLLAQGHARAALVLGWAAIEAIARMLSPGFPATGSQTMQALEVLEHLGRMRFEDAQELRKLLPLRAKVVHGDFQTPITAVEVEPVLRAAGRALAVA